MLDNLNCACLGCAVVACLTITSVVGIRSLRPRQVTWYVAHRIIAGESDAEFVFVFYLSIQIRCKKKLFQNSCFIILQASLVRL